MCFCFTPHCPSQFLEFSLAGYDCPVSLSVFQMVGTDDEDTIGLSAGLLFQAIRGVVIISTCPVMSLICKKCGLN